MHQWKRKLKIWEALDVCEVLFKVLEQILREKWEKFDFEREKLSPEMIETELKWERIKKRKNLSE